MPARDPLVIYSLPLSGYCAKLRIVLEAKGVDYVEQAPPGGYRSDAYRAIVPTSTIPAMVVEGQAVSESEAIAEYLEERYPRPTLLPGDALRRARIRLLSRFHDLQFEPPVRALFAHVNPQRRDMTAVERHRRDIARLLLRLDELLEPQPFALSPTLSLADCGFAVTLPLAQRLLRVLGADLPMPDRVSQWLQVVHQHPAVQRALAPWRAATDTWLDAQSRPAAVRSPLLDAGWQYIEPLTLDEFTTADWLLLDRQRDDYAAREQAPQVLRLLAASRDDATFGYQINNYRHCLQSATLALRDGLVDEDVVVALLHDLGFVACPDSHGEFAAALLSPYVSERNVWMLRRHALFQTVHCGARTGNDANLRERWRGHPHFEWTARFVDRYDQAAITPAYDCAPLEAFEPLVRRVFARAPQPPHMPE